MNSLWSILRIASSQFPIGGYSYSQGLEWAIESKQIYDVSTAQAWIQDQLLLNLCRFDGPLLLKLCELTAKGKWKELTLFIQQHRTSRETSELYSESQQMGFSLVQLLLDLNEIDQETLCFLDEQKDIHFSVALAIAARIWNIPAQQVITAWLWTWLENQTTVLMKTLPLGQRNAQKLISVFTPVLEIALEQIIAQDIVHIGSAPFGFAINSMRHEEQYSRLFRS